MEGQVSKESDKLGSSGDKAGWKATQEAAQMPERKIWRWIGFASKCETWTWIDDLTQRNAFDCRADWYSCGVTGSFYLCIKSLLYLQVRLDSGN